MGLPSDIANVVGTFRSIETQIATMRGEINSNWQHVPGLGDIEKLITLTLDVQVQLGRLLVDIGQVEGKVSA